MMASKLADPLQIYFKNSSDILTQKDTGFFQFYSELGWGRGWGEKKERKEKWGKMKEEEKKKKRKKRKKFSGHGVSD